MCVHTHACPPVTRTHAHTPSSRAHAHACPPSRRRAHTHACPRHTRTHTHDTPPSRAHTCTPAQAHSAHTRTHTRPPRHDTRPPVTHTRTPRSASPPCSLQPGGSLPLPLVPAPESSSQVFRSKMPSPWRGPNGSHAPLAPPHLPLGHPTCLLRSAVPGSPALPADSQALEPVSSESCEHTVPRKWGEGPASKSGEGGAGFQSQLRHGELAGRPHAGTELPAPLRPSELETAMTSSLTGSLQDLRLAAYMMSAILSLVPSRSSQR